MSSRYLSCSSPLRIMSEARRTLSSLYHSRGRPSIPHPFTKASPWKKQGSHRTCYYFWYGSDRLATLPLLFTGPYSCSSSQDFSHYITLAMLLYYLKVQFFINTEQKKKQKKINKKRSSLGLHLYKLYL